MARYEKLRATSEVPKALAADEGAAVSIAAALNTALFDEHVDNEALRLALLQSGRKVRLDTGEEVWVACAVDSSPPTHLIKFFAIGISKGVPPAIYTSTFDPAVVAERHVDAIRKEMMLTVLGEDDSTPERAQRSIRTRLQVAAEVAEALKDVL